MQQIIIKMPDDAYQELKEAILLGALSSAIQASIVHEDSQRDYHHVGDAMDLKRRCLALAARCIFEGEVVKDPKPVWHAMTDDDFIRAANFMEAEANVALDQEPGDYKSNHSLALKHIAKAYYHADLSNQKVMRNVFGDVLHRYHLLRDLAVEAARG